MCSVIRVFAETALLLFQVLTAPKLAGRTGLLLLCRVPVCVCVCVCACVCVLVFVSLYLCVVAALHPHCTSNSA